MPDNRISPAELESLSEATLDNNLLWLRSFGCEVRRKENLIEIKHPQIRDYSAWLIFEHQEKTRTQLASIFEEIEGSPTAPDIYLDHYLFNPSIEQLLAENNFKPAFINLTLALKPSSKQEPAPLTLQPAERANFEQWLLLYADGFNRHGRDAEVDRRRWLHAFENSDSVRHWFFVKDNDIAGICQTCIANGVVGIYSFTLMPGFRGIRNILIAMQALRESFVEEKGYFYIERLLPINSRKMNSAHRVSEKLINVRTMLGFRRTSVNS